MPLEKNYTLVSWRLGGTCGSTIYMYAQFDLLDKQPLFLIVKTPAFMGNSGGFGGYLVPVRG